MKWREEGASYIHKRRDDRRPAIVARAIIVPMCRQSFRIIVASEAEEKRGR